jgi:hypothetical protein
VTLAPGTRGGADPAADPAVCAEAAVAPAPVTPAGGRLPATGGLPWLPAGAVLLAAAGLLTARTRLRER